MFYGTTQKNQIYLIHFLKYRKRDRLQSISCEHFNSCDGMTISIKKMEPHKGLMDRNLYLSKFLLTDKRSV